MQVCRGLVEAYQQGEANGGSIDWENLDQLILWPYKPWENLYWRSNPEKCARFLSAQFAKT